MFECILCGDTHDDEDGAFDSIERFLGDDERGVAAESWDRAQS